jgi:D-arabinose 1-dehydrogenase-like Zn-dependent alcohol dehydrogenase
MLGTVCAVGKDVDNFKVGDKVGYSYFAYYCGKCE